MWIVKWILFILFFLILVGFALQNQDQEASVQLLKWRTINLPLWVFLYSAFTIGVLFSIIISILNIFKLKAENMKLQKQHRKVKEELNRLRNASIDEDADQFNSDDAENITQSESE